MPVGGGGGIERDWRERQERPVKENPWEFSQHRCLCPETNQYKLISIDLLIVYVNALVVTTLI